jgi:mannose-1-phosphate guanylyltransferase
MSGLVGCVMDPLLGLSPDCAAVILAAGDGVRLSSFTNRIFGRHLPKQFCPLIEGETLIEQTLRRASLLVPLHSTVTVLSCTHEPFFSPLLRGFASGSILIQPENRGTATAILCALMRLIEAGHCGAVAIFPSDHYVSDDFIFMRHVAAAFSAVDLSPELIVLLGITPDGPETEYGWIEPGASVAATHPALGGVTPIRRFWEKPSLCVAHDLYDGGCLWNSFIVVADVAALLSLIARALPELYSAFARAESFMGTVREKEVLETIYRDLPPMDFSSRVLAEFPGDFSVLPVIGVEWSDLGDPKRLLAVISNGKRRPLWLATGDLEAAFVEPKGVSNPFNV